MEDRDLRVVDLGYCSSSLRRQRQRVGAGCDASSPVGTDAVLKKDHANFGNLPWMNISTRIHKLNKSIRTKKITMASNIGQNYLKSFIATIILVVL
jgi:hypothetical protein